MLCAVRSEKIWCGKTIKFVCIDLFSFIFNPHSSQTIRNEIYFYVRCSFADGIFCKSLFAATDDAVAARSYI